MGEGEPDEDAIAAARARFAVRGGGRAAALGDNEFMVGGRFWVADLGVGAITGFAKMAEQAELPAAVDAYVLRMEARPALAAPAPGRPESPEPRLDPGRIPAVSESAMRQVPVVDGIIGHRSRRR